MVDMEKLRKGLAACASDPYTRYDCRAYGCEYLDSEGGCIQALCRDALEALKEQKEAQA